LLQGLRVTHRRKELPASFWLVFLRFKAHASSWFSLSSGKFPQGAGVTILNFAFDGLVGNATLSKRLWSGDFTAATIQNSVAPDFCVFFAASTNSAMSNRTARTGD